MLDCLKSLNFDEDGLIPTITQDVNTGEVLMFAFMNAESLTLSIKKKQAVYYSRSRQKIWHKGEKSGHFQQIKTIKTDCDADVILLSVEQTGGITCHTGRKSCFFQSLDNQQQWQNNTDIIKDPKDIYQ